VGESRDSQIFGVPLITSGMGKATTFKFGRYIQRVHTNRSRLKIWEKLERGRIQGLPKFFEYPLLSQEWINFKFCMHILSIDRNKSTLQISGKVAGGICEDSRKHFRAPIYWAHRAVVFAIARLSCYCYIGYSGHVIDAMIYALTLFKLCN